MDPSISPPYDGGKTKKIYDDNEVKNIRRLSRKKIESKKVEQRDKIKL